MLGVFVIHNTNAGHRRPRPTVIRGILAVDYDMHRLLIDT